MSRSRRNTPCMAVTSARSDKPYKRAEHRRERAVVHVQLGPQTQAVDLPHAKTFGDPWAGQKDGKQWLPPDPTRARWMRK